MHKKQNIISFIELKILSVQSKLPFVFIILIIIKMFVELSVKCDDITKRSGRTLWLVAPYVLPEYTSTSGQKKERKSTPFTFYCLKLSQKKE